MGKVSFKMKSHLCRLFVVGFLFAVGCFSPNVRIWSDGNLRAMGSFGSKRAVSYFSVCIGNDQMPFDGQQSFVIRLSNGTLFFSSDLSEATVKRVMLSQADSEGNTVWDNSSTGERTYRLGGAIFVYKEGRLVEVRIGRLQIPGETYIPELSNPDMKTFWAFPIPEEGLRQIFGMPDQIQDVIIW